MTPLTGQEQSIRDILVSQHFSFSPHYVFELSPTVRMSVDFLVFRGTGVVLECTYCTRARGSTMSEARRRSAFMEYRFGLLKNAYPAIFCGALVEAPKEDQETLKAAVTGVLQHADFAAISLDELEGILRELK